MSVNKVILVGNVGQDPEVRYLEGGVAVANFSMATAESYTSSKTGEKVTQTEWHNIVLWRKLAEIAEIHLKKGMQIYIEGRLKSRSYDDKEGIKRYITEVYGDQMQFLGKRREESKDAAESKSEEVKDSKEESSKGDDEHPF